MSVENQNGKDQMTDASLSGRIIHSGRKVTKPIPDSYSICSKINYTEIRKQKIGYVSVGYVHSVQRYMRLLFASCLMRPGKEFIQWREQFPWRDGVDLFGTGDLVNVSLNSFWQVTWERDARQCSALNTRCTCQKHNLTLRLLEETDGLTQARHYMKWPVWTLVQS
jgi:hypothetical protein